MDDDTEYDPQQYDESQLPNYLRLYKESQGLLNELQDRSLAAHNKLKEATNKTSEFLGKGSANAQSLKNSLMDQLKAVQTLTVSLYQQILGVDRMRALSAEHDVEKARKTKFVVGFTTHQWIFYGQQQRRLARYQFYANLQFEMLGSLIASIYAQLNSVRALSKSGQFEGCENIISLQLQLLKLLAELWGDPEKWSEGQPENLPKKCIIPGMPLGPGDYNQY